MGLPTVPDIDDRITCGKCLNGCRPGPCQAARRGEIVTSRSYDPDRSLLHRCEAFRPLPSDPDQRNGRQRWPRLNYQPTKEKSKK